MTLSSLFPFSFSILSALTRSFRHYCATAFLMLVSVCIPFMMGYAHAAEQWPNRNIHLVVPFPGGSSTDLLTRTLEEHLSESLEQNIVVENRPGAGGKERKSVVEGRGGGLGGRAGGEGGG